MQATPFDDGDPKRDPVFLLRRLRKLLGLTQEQVARFAAIAVRHYRRLENLSQLPRLFELLNRIMSAFGMPLSCNFLNKKGAEGPGRSFSTVAACYRSPYLFLALMNGDRTTKIRVMRVGRKQDVYLHLEPALVDLSPDLFITEAGLVAPGQLGRYSGTTHTLSLLEAKRIILPGVAKPTNERLFRDLAEHYPEHRKRITILPNDRVAMSDRRRVNGLIAVSLGIADHMLHHHGDADSGSIL